MLQHSKVSDFAVDNIVGGVWVRRRTSLSITSPAAAGKTLFLNLEVAGSPASAAAWDDVRVSACP